MTSSYSRTPKAGDVCGGDSGDGGGDGDNGSGGDRKDSKLCQHLDNTSFHKNLASSHHPPQTSDLVVKRP